MKYFSVIRFTFLFLFLLPLNAHAYLGPGLGAGTIGAILGVIGSVFLALFAIVYYPVKRFLKKRGLLGKGSKTEITKNAAGPDQTGGTGE